MSRTWRTGLAPPAPVERELTSGLGKYRVLFELGRGGMAAVYLAVTQGTAGVNKLVVLKTLHHDQESDPEALPMFLDEARLAVQLNHGNLVQTYEIDQQVDRHVIVMEYLEGQSLGHVVRRAEMSGRPLPLALHLRVLIQVLEGLQYTHELRGYDGAALHPVHRDVSPQNVFVTYDGRTKLLDFGIAKAASSTTHTAAGLLKGKIAYMCPEQMAGEEVDRRADVYSVGCMLWAAATGRKLWKDAQDTQVLRDVLGGAIPPPRSQNADCHPELERIVMKALAPTDTRYGSALELQADLERFCDEQGFEDRPRDLGRFVSELFADVRSELRTRIEQELGAPVPPSKPFAVETAAALPSFDTQGPAASSRTMSASTVSTATRHSLQPPRRHWGLVAVGLVGLAGAAYALAARRDVPGSIASAPAAAVQPKSLLPEPLAAPVKVNIVLSSSPSSARLFLDDRALDGNPAQVQLDRRDDVHVLRAELSGYRATSIQFSATRDETVELTLEKLAAGRTPRRDVTSSKASQTASTAGRRAAAVDCSQPFFVGPDGIKKIKPSCM